MLQGLVAIAILSVAACDGEGVTASPDVASADGALEDGGTLDVDTLDAVDSAEVEVLYPGYVCGGDDQCSTGLCYGLANSQGHFEPPKCQSICLDLMDYDRYCDSDDDCCKGRCCVGCGAREGLCVLD